MHVIRHDHITSYGHTKLVPSPTDIAFERSVGCAWVANLVPMKCADRDELQRRIVNLKDSRESGRATLDRHAIYAADSAASTATSRSKCAERLRDF